MFRIRRIHDTVLPINKDAFHQVKDILQAHFVGVSQGEVEHLEKALSNPFKQRFLSILFVAENIHGKVHGFALVFHDPNMRFCFLDYLAAGKGLTGGGRGL